MATKETNNSKERISVATQRKIEELDLGIKNLFKNVFNICIFSFKYSYMT